MGNDGGSIPSRGELVKTKARPTKDSATAAANNDFAWTYCPISRKPLHVPLVSDALGTIYNKESILMALLDPEGAASLPSHIRSLKDTVVLDLGVAHRGSEKNPSANQDEGLGNYTCPITRRDMNGLTKFVYLVPCGHVMAAEALRHSGSAAPAPISATETHDKTTSTTTEPRKQEECLMCSVTYDPSHDVIPLNPSGAALETLRARLKWLEETGTTHSGTPLKSKTKKKKRRTINGHQLESATLDGPIERASPPRGTDTPHKKAKKSSTSATTITTTTTTSTTTDPSSRAAGSGGGDGKRSKVLESLFHSTTSDTTIQDGFLTRGISSRIG